MSEEDNLKAFALKKWNDLLSEEDLKDELKHLAEYADIELVECEILPKKEDK
jgi:hypothetical protein